MKISAHIFKATVRSFRCTIFDFSCVDLKGQTLQESVTG